MKSLFFYGSLAHRPLLEVVLGRAVGAAEAKTASLADFASFWVKGQAYPMLLAHKGAVANGLLVSGLSPQDLARLDFYEGGFAYCLKPLMINTANGPEQADVYFPKDELSRGAPWHLPDWQAEWGDFTTRAATEAMGYFGQIDADELARRFAGIRRRAAAYIRGQAQSGRAGSLNRTDVTALQTRTPYSHFYTLQEYDLQHRQFSGEISGKIGAPIERAVFTGFDAAIVLPYDPLRDCVLLIEQFRIGPYARGAQTPWLLEAVAGHIDTGETPEQAARREAQEEAGLDLQRLIPINQAYPSPGGSTEFYYIFLGLCDLSGAGGTTAGLADEHEDIHSHLLSFDDAMEFAAGRGPHQGGANVLPLITALYWLALNRDQLRKGA